VEEGGAAANAGLKMGDVITKVDDTVIKDVDDLNMAKKAYSAGDTATLTFYRKNQEMTTEVTWDVVPADQQANVKDQQQSQNNYGNQYGGGYMNPWDMFDYFFGNRW